MPGRLPVGREDSETTPLTLESGSARQASSRTAAAPQQRLEAATDTSGSLNAASDIGVHKFSTFAVGALACLTYIALSSGMILFNKFLMRDNVFPFPVALTSMHMFCSLILALSLQRLCPSLFPAFDRVFAKKSEDLDYAAGSDSQVHRLLHSLSPFIPIAVCGAISLVASNSAFRYASVSFLQMCKESHIMFVYLFMLMAGLDKFKFRMAAVIAFVACSAMVAVYGEIYFSWQGLLLQTVGGLCGSGQIVLNNVLMARSSMGKIDPLTLVLCTAPVMLFALIPANVFFWDARIITRLPVWLPYLALNALLAFALQISAATLIWVASGTGYALTCVAKDLAIVGAAQVILHESFTSLQATGFAGAISGMVIYSAMKLSPEKFEPSK